MQVVHCTRDALFLPGRVRCGDTLMRKAIRPFRNHDLVSGKGNSLS